MELLTLDSATLMPQRPIEKFSSAIWTERYSSVGEVQIVGSPSDIRPQIQRGTFLACRGSDEVARIDTVLTENGVTKAAGNMITQILDDRFVRGPYADYTDPPTPSPTAYTLTATPGNALQLLVQDFVVVGGSMVSTIPDGTDQVIPNLAIDLSVSFPSYPPIMTIEAPMGSILNALNEIAQTWDLGFKIYLADASASGYLLKFKAYQGVRRTTGYVDEPVRFAPDLDNISGMSWLESDKNFKNMAYVYGSDDGTFATRGPSKVFNGDPSDEPIGFDRRVLVVEATDVNIADAGDSTTFHNMLAAKGQEALRQHNLVQVVDGEVSKNSQYKFGQHYAMGDIVEIDGGNGFISPARITEYIRMQDATGAREYPTVTVIDE